MNVLRLRPGLIAVVATIAACAQVALAADEAADFERHIAPLLEQRCVRCHHEETHKGGLSLHTREAALRGGDSGPLFVPGKPQESLLLEMIGGAQPAMPEQGEKLTQAQVQRFEQWIAAGANWPADRTLVERAPQRDNWWSLQPIRRPALPAVRDAHWPRNALDHFILAKLEQQQLGPSPPADARVLLRRLSFDLWGLPPSPSEVAAFAANQHPLAYDDAVDEKLNALAFGERYARHWLDLVRFAETHGFEMNNERPNAWPYRDYVIDAFRRDLPYDQFVREQLAGDRWGRDEATGFLVAGAWDQVRSPDPVLSANQRADELHDIVSATGATFLGMTVGCARCHDHKFDPIPQTDYYALKAVFEGVQHGERELTARAPADRAERLAALRGEQQTLDRQLQAFEPLAASTRLIQIPRDDARVEQLVPTKDVQPYTPGAARGQRGFVGDGRRLPTIGSGYLYWNNVSGRDVLAWSPRVTGKFRVWASWGCGWNTHATDARYVLDADGDLSTRDDQREIATADHQHFADGEKSSAQKPLWSGLANLGVHDWTESARLLLRGGKTNAYLAADLLVLEEVTDQPSGEKPSPALPRLRKPIVAGTNLDRFAPTSAKFLRFSIHESSSAQPCLDELEVLAADSRENVALASRGTLVTASSTLPGHDIHRLEHVHDGRYGNSASWISNENGRGWVQFEFPRVERIDLVRWGRDQSQPPKYVDRLPLQYAIEVSLDGRTWQTVASSGDRLLPQIPFPAGSLLVGEAGDGLAMLVSQRQHLDQQIAAVSAVPKGYSGKLQQPGATHRFHRGDPLQPREAVEPRALSTIKIPFSLNDATREQDRRVALAQWLTADNHPLTARVIVNRVWQWHFGEGLVDTPSDFGVNGTRPTHPELLDWLAAELIDSGWSLRHIHRLILTSATYRQASLARDNCLAVDASSRLLWRFPPRRLEAEALRDAMLTVSGTLDPQSGGPGFSPFEPNSNYVRVYTPKQQFAPGDFRRMIYMTKIRMQVDPTFGSFDCPDGGQMAPKRSRSTTPLQALNLLNSSLILAQVEAFAARLRREAGDDPADQVRLGFQLAFQRQPDAAEQQACLAAIQTEGLTVFCRALLNSNEFVFLE
jgi:hypothetical protein